MCGNMGNHWAKLGDFLDALLVQPLQYPQIDLVGFNTAQEPEPEELHNHDRLMNRRTLFARCCVSTVSTWVDIWRSSLPQVPTVMPAPAPGETMTITDQLAKNLNMLVMEGGC